MQIKKKVKIGRRIKMERKMQELKEERGITLLALIITVVIMIILASVTISITLGEGGIINQAKEAAENTKDSAQREQEEIANLTSYLEGLNAKTVVEAFNAGELQVGDYVDYVPDAHDPVTVGTDETGFTDREGYLRTTDQTYSQDTENTHWRVLGLSENGQNLMLLGSQLRKDGWEQSEEEYERAIGQYLFLEGATGYLNAVDTLNKICSLYHNSTLAQETRSIKIEDINRALGGIEVTYPEEGNPGPGTVTLATDSSGTNIGRTTYYPSYTYKAGDYSPESYPSEVSDQIGTKVSENEYSYGIWDYSYLQSLGATISERGYNMLFEETISPDDYVKDYWLAFHEIGGGFENIKFGLGVVSSGDVGTISELFASYGYGDSSFFAVRPVIVLKSGVTVNDLHKIADQTEEEWKTCPRSQ